MASLITKNKASIPRRLHLLFLIIVLLFVGLILRLAYMQIYTTSFYVSKLKSSTVYKVKVAQPRGKIFDFSGKPLCLKCHKRCGYLHQKSKSQC